MRWLLLAVLFVVVPLAELWAILTVGHAIGVLPTIALLLVDSVLGAALVRSQGRGAWRRFLAAFRSGRVPSRELADGVLIVVGGALLLTPGFLTDVLGFALLIPPTRALVRRALERTIARWMVAGVAGAATRVGAAGSGGERRPGGRSPHDDVEGTARDDGEPAIPGEPPRLER